jgi:hypothetical protein
LIFTENPTRTNKRFPVLQAGPQLIGVDNTSEKYKMIRPKGERSIERRMKRWMENPKTQQSLRYNTLQDSEEEETGTTKFEVQM